MYKVTRDFIKERSLFARLPVKHRHVRQIGGGRANDCFYNSYFQSNQSAITGIKVIAISGWIVMPYDKISNSTEIIQHWWNFDTVNSVHFDTTPFPDNVGEYVMDIDIYDFSRINFDFIRSSLAINLLYQDDKFFLLKDIYTQKFELIDELRTESLFDFI